MNLASDLIFNGDNSKWLKFVNTLRLRLALRISKVDPAKAKIEAEAAVAGGVMTAVTENGYLKVARERPNPLGYISGWNEFRMSSTVESLLKGYNDPRLSSYFQPAVSDGQYRGVRNGMIPAEQVLPANGVKLLYTGILTGLYLVSLYLAYNFASKWVEKKLKLESI